KKGKQAANGTLRTDENESWSKNQIKESVLSTQSTPTHRHFGKLRGMLESASGVSISENDLDSSFFELGLDSLILTQFTFSLKKEFGVQISFRQLNDTHNTPKSILDFLDEVLPGETSTQEENPESLQKDSSDKSQAIENHDVKKEEAKNLSFSKHQNFIKLREMLQSASGVEISENDLESSFFELGLDSLILTQFVFSLKREFGVQVSFLQLNDTLNTPQSVLDYIDVSLSKPGKSMRAGSKDKPAIEQANGEGSISLIKQQLADITRQVKEIKNGQRNEPISPEDSTSGQNETQIGETKLGEKKISQSQPFNSPSALSSGGKFFLDNLEQNYFKKTAKSKIQATQLRGKILNSVLVEGDRTLELDHLSYPIVADRLNGSKIFDLDGNVYVDWVNGKGANLFGNNPPFISEAIKRQFDPGNESGSIGSNFDTIKNLVENLYKVEDLMICPSESEAKQRALQLAFSTLSKPMVVRFASPDDPSFQLGSVNSRPIQYISDEELILEYGNPKSIDIIAQLAEQVAAVWVEPILIDRPDFLPVEFLLALRSITDSLGICLILDETVTGFRVHAGGIQQLIGIQADLVVLGAMDSTGFPVSILGGSSKWLDKMSKSQKTTIKDFNKNYRDLDLSGSSMMHPLALATTKTYLKEIIQRGPTFQEKLAQKTDDLVSRLNGTFNRFNCPYKAFNFKSIWKIEPKSKFPYWEILFIKLRQEGVFIWEDRFCFMTEAHTSDEIDLTILKLESALEQLIENELVSGDLPDLEEVLMDVKNPPFPGAKIGFDSEGNPRWINPLKK
ncbi:MAG TPA: aminotransferase class III-fold pyridoxal phosphate-dependent enzyme, partial [Algoriphagus sp.]|nr:aminotransferase class III-fold pyridoxal phosphate-dependent enzyme [Algoriphagus sp.]